jgi:nitrile hydratase accessory protein
LSLPETSLLHSPGLKPSNNGGPAFPEPWAAEAFALTIHLYERGLFTWAEWAQSLSAQLDHQDPEKCGEDYFDCWVAALASLIESRGIADRGTVEALRESWQRAAEATPHGQPIELANDPLRTPHI